LIYNTKRGSLMIKHLLLTKLFIPPIRPDLVPRPRLVEGLQAGFGRKLTLVSAPAGYGKSTLLSEWVHQIDRPVAWLSLDRGDNIPSRFWSYFGAALQTIPGLQGTQVCENLLDLVHVPQPLSQDGPLTDLIAEIAEIPERFILILDDLHLVTEPQIHNDLTFLVEHLPPPPGGMHLVIASRSDPPWPMARLRVGAEINEVRSKDLRFSSEEATAFLNENMGLKLSPREVIQLDQRTEGWVAGLQLAALSMQGRVDISGFLRGFSGSHHFILDYLMEEVLNQQPPEILDFLHKTSILDRLNAQLCDTVTGSGESQAILNQLEKTNMFLVPLDEERRWYRYHQLFNDLLNKHLKQSQPDILPDLHDRASRWFEQNDLPQDAIKHALVANDIPRVAQLTEGIAVHKMELGELKMLLEWFDSLPKEELQKYPWLSIARSWALVNSGQYEAADLWLQVVEKRLPEKGAVQTGGEARLRGYIAAIQVYVAEFRTGLSLTIQLAHEALSYLPEQDMQLRAFIAIRLANCLGSAGDLEGSRQAFLEAYNYSKLIGDRHLVVNALSEMAGVLRVMGKLQNAEEILLEARKVADTYAQKEGRQLTSIGILYRQYSIIELLRNDLDTAIYYAQKSVEQCRFWGEQDPLFHATLWQAVALEARGDQDGFVSAMERARQIATSISPQLVDFFKLWEVNFQLRQGDLSTAQALIRDLGLQVDDDINFVHRFEYETYARLLLAERQPSQVLKFISKLLDAGIEAGAEQFVLKYHILHAIALQDLGQDTAALSALQKALGIAKKEGMVRPVVEEGTPVRMLLQKAISQDVEAGYATELLLLMTKEVPARKPSRVFLDGVGESLSERELVVLRLLDSHLSIPEIAHEMYIAPSTVRTHVRNIYSKLNVHNRIEAIQKAKELGLI
jgi:LuxR family maltose regulon positive regulatory protein